jgi:hypothetical protein
MEYKNEITTTIEIRWHFNGKFLSRFSRGFEKQNLPGTQAFVLYTAFFSYLTDKLQPDVVVYFY